MVCDSNETDLDINIPAVMLPQDAGASLESNLKHGDTVSVQLYSPNRPLVDIAEVFLWLMAVCTILCASYWSAWSVREASIEHEKLLRVSHHPPMSAAHVENEHFTYDVTSKLKTKFSGNSVEVYPVGMTRVTLKKSGVVFDLVPPPIKVNNLIFGRTWVDSPGEMVMTNLITGDKVVLYFQPCGWFGAGRYEVDGYVYDAVEERKILMTGKWNKSMSCQPCDQEGEPLPGTELKE